MTPQELLKPRYEVTAPYPFSHYEVGDLVVLSNSSMTFHCITTKEYSSFSDKLVDVEKYINIAEMQKYPHLFRRLHWAEKRDERDLPEYVKNKDGKVLKVWKYHLADKFFLIIGSGDPYRLYDHEPATEEEYTQYINSLK